MGSIAHAFVTSIHDSNYYKGYYSKTVNKEENSITVCKDGFEPLKLFSKNFKVSFTLYTLSINFTICWRSSSLVLKLDKWLTTNLTSHHYTRMYYVKDSSSKLKSKHELYLFKRNSVTTPTCESLKTKVSTNT